MKALTWKDPYGTLMLHGKIETRTWNTNYRGLVLISVGLTAYTNNELIDFCDSRIDLLSAIDTKVPPENGYKGRGLAIAVGDLVDCRPMQNTEEDEAACYLAYKDGLYCHIYENVRPIEPIKYTGHQGWRTLQQVFIDTLVYPDELGN